MNTPLPQVMIAEITHLLTTDFDSRTLLESITERTRRSFTAAWSVLLLRATDSPGVEIVCEAVEEGYTPHHDLVHRNPVLLSALTGSVVMIDDFETASSRWHAFAQDAASSGLGACRVFPLRLAERPLGALAVFTTDPWNSRPRDNAFGQSLADLAAIALSLSDVDGRSEAATVAAQHILASRTTIEQAAGVIAELDHIDIDSAMKALATRAQARGMTVARYAERVVEDPEFR